MDSEIMTSLLQLDQVVDEAENDVIHEAETGLQRDIFQSLEALDKVVAEAEQEEEDPMLFGLQRDIFQSIEALDKVVAEAEQEEEDPMLFGNEEVRKSIEALDSIIDEYDEDYGFASHQPRRRPRSGSHDFTLCCHHQQHQQPLITSSPSQNSILRNQEYSTGPRRHPPQVPKRNPETRLSVSSESSQQDDVAPPPREYDDTPESGYQTSEVDTQGSEFEYPLHPGSSVPYRGGHGGREYYAHSDTQSLYGSETPSPITAPRAPPVPPNSLMGIDTGFRGSTSSIPGFPPPPPPGTEEETFTTHLPSRFDDMAADDLYGVSLPQSNGYPEGPQELYGTTLPKPLPELRNPPSTLPKKAPVPPPGPTPICPPPPAPPQFSPTSPERDFPPPPPPLQFADGSPKHNAPPTAPKPRRGSGPASPVFSAATMPPRHQDHAPPPPPLATMPRLTHAQPDVVPPPPVCSMPGDLLSNGGAPPPPPTSTIPRQLNRNVQSPPRAPSPPPLNSSSLAAQLARVQLRTAEVTEDERPTKPGAQPHARQELISQIQHGVNLKSSPLGNKIRGDADDESPPSELAAPPPPPLNLTENTAAPNGDNTLTKPPPPPTLPKTKSVPSTMPSGGEQQSNTSSIELDPRTIPGYQEIPENCPTWKKAMIEKKNKQLEDDTKKTMIAQREEEERWKGVPEWKKKIIMEKQKKKADDEALTQTEIAMTEEQAAKMKDMPEWKRDLLRKKRGDV